MKMIKKVNILRYRGSITRNVEAIKGQKYALQKIEAAIDLKS